MIGKWASSSLLALLLGGLALTGAAAVVPAPAQHASYRKTNDGVLLPDPHATPGAIDQNVTQANIRTTICRAGYTKGVRPPVSLTNRLKRGLMQLYWAKGQSAEYELDHLISLELGGCPACRTNLWPESYLPKPGAREKDQLENAPPRFGSIFRVSTSCGWPSGRWGGRSGLCRSGSIKRPSCALPQ